MAEIVNLVTAKRCWVWVLQQLPADKAAKGRLALVEAAIAVHPLRPMYK